MALKAILIKAIATLVSLSMVTAEPTCEYLGCYREGTDARALSGLSTTSDEMTTETCRQFCNGSRMFGVEYGTECYCGMHLGAGAYQVPQSACDVPCGGNEGQICGGVNLLSVYRLNFTSQTPDQEFTSLGCYAEPSDDRALERVLSSPQMTTRKCLVVCSYRSYAYAGLEFGNECWCGNELHPDTAPSADGCDLPCSGNASDTCGGHEALNLYCSNYDDDDDDNSTASNNSSAADNSTEVTPPVSVSLRPQYVAGEFDHREELAAFLADQLL